MAQNPRMVINDMVLTWDGVQTPVTAGTIVDVPAGSALESAYGLSNLASLNASQQSGDAQGGDESGSGTTEGGGSDD